MSQIDQMNTMQGQGGQDPAGDSWIPGSDREHLHEHGPQGQDPQYGGSRRERQEDGIVDEADEAEDDEPGERTQAL